ncbi:hypothetical protein N7532_002540 [Penicillium argentinense]|uniref:GAR domain-containing protein n=1 Tax=Penicillium argentinense TaxID=1131581 RepID=A0A9W9G1I4_9EURO|nr:uncharacterized protein N7532_002540 [Penicillium argentinense]KAJ5109895.1 hypothetical protein N7532_002540 [Penicillium argentinense]
MATSRISPLRPSIRLSPAHSRDNSRSASPDRHPESLYQKIDPLLAKLSPESTLHALTSTEAVPSNEKFSHDVLSQSISQVSPAERALGIRAAVAAQNLNVWYKEVQAWSWPKHVDAKQGKGFVPPVDTQAGDNGNSSRPDASNTPVQGATSDVAYYGCLPSGVVEQYEQRIEEIRDGMDDLNVEELKEHVLSAHIPSRSRPSSSTSTVSVPPPLSYVQLSDFTAVVTATILRALPFLSRLNSLLTTWDVRLVVLRQIPGLLRELKLTRTALEASFHTLRTSDPSETSPTFLSSSYLRDEHVKLESAVVAVGRRMDRALDALEGRQDSLPDSWIDDLEGIESNFAAWVVEVEQYKLRTEWLRTKEQPKTTEESKDAEPKPNTTTEEAPEETQMQETRIVEITEPEIPDHAQMEIIEEESKHEIDIPTTIEQHDSQTETSEEETKFETNTPTDTNTGKLDEAQPAQEPELSSTESDSILPTSSEPDTPPSQHISEGPIDPCVSEESKELPQSVPTARIVEEAQTPTPTQATFPPFPSIQEVQELSPTRLPLPATPSIENKENIPPPEFVQEHAPPSRESSTKPTALAERQVDDDPFVQRPASPKVTKVDVPATPQVSVSVDPPSEDICKADPAPSQAVEPESVNTSNAQPPVGGVSMDCDSKQAEQLIAQPVSVQSSEIMVAHTLEFESKEDSPAPTVVEKSPVDTAPVDSLSQPTETYDPVPQSTESIQKPLPQQQPHYSVKDSFKPTESCPPKQAPSKKPLQSPIKLGKLRPGKLNLSKDAPKPRYRRPSTGSVGSLPSNNSSLISSPNDPGPHTGSSKDGPLLTPPLSDFPQPPSLPSRSDHALREDRLRRLDRRKVSPRTAFQENRTVSLPLERFINEKMDLEMDNEEPTRDATSRMSSKKAPTSRKPHPIGSSAPPPVPSRSSSRRPALTRGKSASDLKASDQASQNAERNVRASSKNAALRSVHNQGQPKSVRLRQRLTAHPSLESLGVKRQELDFVEEDESELTDLGSRASSPNRQRRKPRDRLDEKVNSILSTLPGRINLVDPNNEADTSSSSSSMDRRMRERYLSESPQGAPSRSMTPGPSLTLMPAARRRSQVFKSEDSCVRLYHLQHAGQSAPTKLFVRTVGEEGQRVMVRVGGGWADLGEYLREYVIHHGRRKVSESPRVEVQGLASRSSPGSMLSPPAPTYMSSGRATPSRPPSVMSARPASSLNVRKVRRSSNASEIAGSSSRSVTTGALASFTSPPSASGGRRLSMSSSYSFGDSHSPGRANSLAPDSHSTPLGLAGPKPRSRQVSMSPEGEAWVEDVLQQTRRSGTLNPPPFPLNATQETDHHDISDTVSVHSLPKVRSVSDIGSIGTNRRVVLKGLSSRK